jgi:2-C-methyl-D-erythritol 2,4-cyclodiphosphate synthase
MRECLAKVMGIGVDRVSVKATTTEKLGFVGRGEGCEVYAAVLLRRD